MSYYTVVEAFFTIDPIKWRVLGTETGIAKKALILSEFNLDARRFDGMSNQYGISEVRRFLTDDSSKGYFYVSPYFEAAEKNAISPKEIYSEEMPGNLNGMTTSDPVFLLSVEELCTSAYGFLVNSADHDANRVAKNTGYTAARFGMFGPGQANHYWTRSANNAAQYAFAIWQLGSQYYTRVYQGDNYNVIRPALYLNLESILFKSRSDLTQLATDAGKINNPYFLYLEQADYQPTMVSADVVSPRFELLFLATPIRGHRPTRRF